MHTTPPRLKELLKEQIINLIKNENVDEFLVGEKGGYEIDAYDVVLEVQKEFPHIKIYLVVTTMKEIHSHSDIGYRQYVRHRSFDDFILPEKCEFGYKGLCFVYRNCFIIENTDFIIAFNKYEGRAFEFCKRAKGKGVIVIELSEKLYGEMSL